MIHQSKSDKTGIEWTKFYLPLLLPMPQLPLLSSCRPGLFRGLLWSWVPSEPDPESDAGEEVELLCLQVLDSSSSVSKVIRVPLVLEVLVVLELHSMSS